MPRGTVVAGVTGHGARAAGAAVAPSGGRMIEVRGGVTTHLPPEELFAFVADASNNPSWQRGMVSCTWTTPPPLAVGSTYEQHARFLVRDVRSTFEVVEFEPGRHIRLRTTTSTFPLDVTRDVEPVDPVGSRVLATVRGGPVGVAAVFDPLTRLLVARSVARDYARLGALLAARR